MSTPHRTFFYLFEDYKNNIFRDWWQKEERRKLRWTEIIMLVLLIVFPISSLVIYGVAVLNFPEHAVFAYVPMLAEVVLIMAVAAYANWRNFGTLDEEAEFYYERRIKRLYDSLHEQDYDNQLALAWIIQKCQEIIDQGSGFENMLKRFGRYYIVCILPILSFCAAAILKMIPVIDQCVIGIIGVGLLISIFALSQMIGPEIFEFASKRIRIAKELKEGAEYLLIQGDLKITEKPRAVLDITLGTVPLSHF